MRNNRAEYNLEIAHKSCHKNVNELIQCIYKWTTFALEIYSIIILGKTVFKPNCSLSSEKCIQLLFRCSNSGQVCATLVISILMHNRKEQIDKKNNFSKYHIYESFSFSLEFFRNSEFRINKFIGWSYMRLSFYYKLRQKMYWTEFSPNSLSTSSDEMSRFQTFLLESSDVSLSNNYSNHLNQSKIMHRIYMSTDSEFRIIATTPKNYRAENKE